MSSLEQQGSALGESEVREVLGAHSLLSAYRCGMKTLYIKYPKGIGLLSAPLTYPVPKGIGLLSASLIYQDDSDRYWNLSSYMVHI